MLPANSTDKCQPLDVAFFGPQKKMWRKILEEHRTLHPSSTGIDKSTFPRLLKKLIEGMGFKNKDNIKAGFKACGIFPFDPQTVLKKLPAERSESESNMEVGASTSDSPATQTPKKFISPALLEYLQQFRYDPDKKQNESAVKKKRLFIEPGKSVSEEDVKEMIASQNKSKLKRKVPKSKPSATASMPSTSSATASMPSTTSATASMPSTTSATKTMSSGITPTIANVGDFVLVKLPCGKNKNKFYVAEVRTSDADGLIDVKFMRQSSKAPNKFSFPIIIDSSEISQDDIVMVLERPESDSIKTKRQASLLYFTQDLSFCE